LPFEITPADWKQRLEQQEAIAFIGVGEPFEQGLAAIEGSQRVPMGSLK
jgi:hypothetical protein